MAAYQQFVRIFIAYNNNSIIIIIIIGNPELPKVMGEDIIYLVFWKKLYIIFYH